MIKSGTDFRELSQVTLTFSEDRKHVDVHVEKVVVDSSVEEEPEMKAIVHEYMGAWTATSFVFHASASKVSEDRVN